MKNLIPVSVRRSIRVAQRWLSDLNSGQLAILIKASPQRRSEGAQLKPWINLVQDIRATEYSENKRHNLALAVQQINYLVIEPGELFSFWTLIGAPTQRKGYLPGRSLVNQTLQTGDGGGLCQLSGLLYYLALRAGLQIVERYPHSVDIYTDETRFAPLGSDATVVYGYKDFRFRNSLQASICFYFDVETTAITGQMWASQRMPDYQIEFVSQRLEAGIEIETLQYPSDQDSSPGAKPLSLGKCCYICPFSESEG